MAKETLYFSHDCNARNDRKLVSLRMQHGMQGVGVYWCIVEMLYEEGGYLPLEYERITFELRIEENVLRSILTEFDLFVLDGDKFYSPAVIERLSKRMEKSEKAKKSIGCRWEKTKNTNVLQSNNECNTNKVKVKVKVKEKTTGDFDLFWEAYPEKKEKSAALDRWKKLNGSRPDIKDILVAIENQKQWRKNTPDGVFIPNWKHPATWLSKGCWADEIIGETKEPIDLLDRYYLKKEQEEISGTVRVYSEQRNPVQITSESDSF